MRPQEGHVLTSDTFTRLPQEGQYTSPDSNALPHALQNLFATRESPCYW